MNPAVKTWYELHDEDLPVRTLWRVDPVTGEIERLGGIVTEIPNDCPICGRELDLDGRCTSCLGRI